MKLLAAFVIDWLLGDPLWLPHPVRLIGKLIGWLESLMGATRTCPGGRRNATWELLAGGLLALVVVGCVWAATIAVVRLVRPVHTLLAASVDVLLIYTAIAPRALAEAALAVVRYLKAGDLDGARRSLSEIVGRDTAHLDEPEIIRAAVETVAENTVDGVVAPLFYAALGGAPLAVTYRAVNTLDSMVGYKNEKYLYFGRVSARLDDAANFIPARLGALFLVAAAALAGEDWRTSWRILLRDGRKHPSPNSGLPEAAVAGALGVRLGGLNWYQGRPSVRPHIGEARNSFKREHVYAAVKLMYLASLLCLVTLVLAEAVLSGLVWGFRQSNGAWKLW